MRVIKPHPSFAPQATVPTRLDYLNSLNDLLGPYPIKLKLLKGKSSFGSAHPSCLMGLTSRQVTIIPQEEIVPLTSDEEYLVISGEADSSLVNFASFHLDEAFKYFYSSQTFTLERVDNDRLMILSKYFNFSILFNLTTFQFRVFGSV